MMNIQDNVELCFPQLLNSSCRKPMLPWSEATFLNTVLSFVSVITVVFNLLIIITVSHFRQLHTPTNIISLSLAVSDFFVGLMLMPLELYRKISCWFLGNIMCALYSYITANIISASIGSVVLISADRYVAICLPLHYPTRITLARAKCTVCFCWICAASCAFFYTKDELSHPGRSNSCLGECTYTLTYVIGIVDLSLNFIIPVTVIILLYTRIFVVAVSQARGMRSYVTSVTFQQTGTLKTKKSELKAARTLGVLVVIHLLCYCPFYCYSLVVVNLDSNSPASFFYFLFYFNSCLNPLIYALFYPWFRKAVKLILTMQILRPGSCNSNIL